jgi:hypothetical protein
MGRRYHTGGGLRILRGLRQLRSGVPKVGVPPRWPQFPGAAAPTGNERARLECRGLAGCDRHTNFARRTIRALGPGFPEADQTPPQLNDGLQHHWAAAPIAFHRHFPLFLAGLPVAVSAREEDPELARILGRRLRGAAAFDRQCVVVVVCYVGLDPWTGILRACSRAWFFGMVTVSTPFSNRACT